MKFLLASFFPSHSMIPFQYVPEIFGVFFLKFSSQAWYSCSSSCLRTVWHGCRNVRAVSPGFGTAIAANSCKETGFRKCGWRGLSGEKYAIGTELQRERTIKLVERTTFSKHFDHWVKRNYASILASLSIHFKVITSFIGSASLPWVFLFSDKSLRFQPTLNLIRAHVTLLHFAILL